MPLHMLNTISKRIDSALADREIGSRPWTLSKIAIYVIKHAHDNPIITFPILSIPAAIFQGRYFVGAPKRLIYWITVCLIMDWGSVEYTHHRSPSGICCHLRLFFYTAEQRINNGNLAWYFFRSMQWTVNDGCVHCSMHTLSKGMKNVLS